MIVDCDFREILSWERGRPARTRPGAASPLSPTWISRQRRRCFPCGWPMQRPTAGTGCGRDARAPRGCGPADDLSIIRRAPRSRSLVSPSYDPPRRGGRGPDLSETIEGYPQRPKKRNPRRATKDDEGPLRGWRKLKRDPPKVGRGEEISTKGAKVSVKGAKDESAKGSQGVGKDSKGVHEGPRRTLRFSTNAHSIIEPVSFLCSSFSSCLSCLSMFPNATNRFNGTCPCSRKVMKVRCFTLE